jgi:ankyrin repeat protein
VIQALRENGGDEAAASDTGETPLHYCLVHGNAEAAKAMLDKSKRIYDAAHVPDRSGRTAMQVIPSPKP